MNANNGRGFLSNIQNRVGPAFENHLKEHRNSALPYNIQQLNRHQIRNELSTEMNKPKIAPFLFRTLIYKCSFISETRFTVEMKEFNSKSIDILKSIPSKSYDPEKKQWSFAIKDYDLLKECLEGLTPAVILEEIPKNILKIFSQLEKFPTVDSSCLTSINSKLADTLLPFQKEGLRFAISRGGRVLIADEMGLGKTYQALAVADYYRENMPLLICTTASTRNTWAQHVRNLLPYIPCQQISCISSAQAEIASDCKVLILSYSLVEKYLHKIIEKKFGIVIMDESHSIKNPKAKCTMALKKISLKAKRVILLSGTPALSRPVELHSQLQIIDRQFLSFHDYTLRYCAGKQTSFGWDASGQSNLNELNIILKKKFLIRRVKSEVLPELMEKSRETVYLDPLLISREKKITEEIQKYADQMSQSNGRRREEILLEFFSKTAHFKKKAVCAYIRSVVKEAQKFIVFAHHQIMLDAICKTLSKLDVNYIRIDGATKNDLRTEYVKQFQREDSCKVAVLSLLACNAGLTLTAANTIIFAELSWNPSTLVQAESRAHRIGQEGIVKCRYLIAKGTADDHIWNMLKKKQTVLNKAGLFCEDLQDSEFFCAPSEDGDITKYLSISTNSDSSANVSNVSHTNSEKDEMRNNLEYLLDDGDDDDLINCVDLLQDEYDDELANLNI